MGKFLTPQQVARFSAEGYLAPLRIMSEDAARELRAKLEAHERDTGGPLARPLRHKSHLLFTWLAELVRDDTVLDAVEDLYGPNLLCWGTNFFIKEARDPSYVSWHQDSTYWGLSRPDVVSAWVALTESNRENGALEVIPGSHLLDQLPHRDTFAGNNLLSRGQEVAVEVDGARAVRLDLRPGEMSLHHVRLVHGSPPNTSSARRIGVAIRYIPTHVRQLHGEDSATLVRGVDDYRSFAHEPRPQRDFDPEFRALHSEIMARSLQLNTPERPSTR